MQCFENLDRLLAIQPQHAYILVARWLISGSQRLKERERYIFLWLGGLMARQQRLQSQNTLYEKGLLCFNGWPGGSVAHQCLSQRSYGNQPGVQKTTTQKTKTYDLENDDLENDDLENNNLENDDLENDDLENDDLENNDLENDDLENDDLENDDLENDDLENDDLENNDLENDNLRKNHAEGGGGLNRSVRNAPSPDKTKIAYSQQISV